jgi:hypothetical protein
MQTLTSNVIGPKARHQFLGDLTTLDVHAALKKLPAGVYDVNRASVQAANTFVTAPDFLQPAAISKAVDVLAPLRSYTLTFDPAPFSPEVTNQIKLVKTASATQTNPTNYQVGGSTVDAVAVTVTHFNQPFSVSNKEYNGGLRIDDLLSENLLTLCQTIAGTVCSTMTAANFPATAVTVAESSFSLANAATAFATIAKCRPKNLILNSGAFSNISHTNGFSDSVRFGWDGIHEQSAGWGSADAGVYGFACGPQAIAVVSGILLPQVSPLVRTRYIGLGDLGIVVEYHVWFDASTRTYWGSLDVVLGAEAADGTAGVLIQSS